MSKKKRIVRLDQRVFSVGDEVEFISGEDESCWKVGVIEEWMTFFNGVYDKPNESCHEFVRIRVSNRVCIIRHKRKVRHRNERTPYYSPEVLGLATA